MEWKQDCVLSALLMIRRFTRAVKIAAREEGFVQILGAGVFLVALGTLVYTLS